MIVDENDEQGQIILTLLAERDKLRRDVEAQYMRAERAEAEAKVIGDRAWNHAITRIIGELHNMKIEDAQRLADRIRRLRTTDALKGGG